MKFNALIPELYVSDYAASLKFYTVLLGFTLEYERTSPQFGFLTYQGSQLMLQQIEPTDIHTSELEKPYGRGINFQIYTDEIDAIMELLKKQNYPIRREMQEHWRDIGEEGSGAGSKEFHVLDPDGYFLRFLQDLGRRTAK